jgi:purine-binding chemotaxis protein CheW
MNEALTLRVQGETLALDARQVREILEPVPVTRVPGAPAAMDGLINVRGRVVPLADLGLLFGRDRSVADADTRIVVMELQLADEEVLVGLLADSVCEVTHIDPATIEAPPASGTRWPPELLTGVGRHDGDFVFIPDLPRIFENLGGDVPPSHSLERSLP